LRREKSASAHEGFRLRTFPSPWGTDSPTGTGFARVHGKIKRGRIFLVPLEPACYTPGFRTSEIALQNRM
jgi:hypothetical protein